MKPIPSIRGFILIPVSVAIAIIGVLAFYTANQSAINVNATSSEQESYQAELVAQAGIQHGLREVANQGCGPYSDLTNVNFANDQYTTNLTHDLGSTTAYTLNVDQDTWIGSFQSANNHGNDQSLHISQSGGDSEIAMLRYDLAAIPVASSILSARAWFYVETAHAEGPVEIRSIDSNWLETGATWDSIATNISSETIASIAAQSSAGAWVSVNLTALVQAWANGQPNFGVALVAGSEGIDTIYQARDALNAPYLAVTVGTPASPYSQLKSVGTLANGVKRTLLRNDVVLQQAPASLVHLQPGAEGQDAEIWDQAPDNNYGNADETWVSSASNDKTRTLLRFEMGRIPQGAKILDASLSLLRRSGQGANLPVSAHRITNTWVEDQVTWNRRQTGINWGSSGADYDSEAVSTIPIGSANIRYEWDIASLVQGWVNGVYPNYGVILVPAVAGMTGERFHTSDHADSTNWPSLNITYTCPCGTACISAQGSGGRIVMIGDWPSVYPDPRDLEKAAIIESWGYQVDHADDNFIWSINFNDYDLVYVSETASSSAIQGQIDWRSIPAVIEQGNSWDDFYLSNEDDQGTGVNVDVVDNSHYITAPFAPGTLRIYDKPMEILTTVAPLAPDLQILIEHGGNGSLTVLDAGATSLGGPAPGRRVTLPLGRSTNSNFNWQHLNNNGRLLVQRAIEWGMGNDIVSIGNLLLVVNDDNDLTTQEQAKQALFESWGWTVNIIDSGDNQTAFDTAAAANDVAYITEDINSGDLGTKLVGTSIGVVTEEANLSDEFGFNDSNISWGSGTDLTIFPSHYITSDLPLGTGTILTTSESLAAINPNLAPGMQSIGFSEDGVALATLDTGAALAGGGSAAGRRVFLPWGGSNMDINHLNADGLTILERSLEWANGADMDFNPLAHWKLDENNGTTALDSEGGNHGSLNNNPIWSAGMHDGGLRFDGIDDSVAVGSQEAMDDLFFNGATITGWIYADGWGGGNFGRIADKADALGSNRNGWAFELYGANRALLFQYGFSGAIGNWYTPVDSIGLDQWHHVAVSYDNSTDTNNPTIYIDGVAQTLIELDTPSGTPSSDANSDLHIGNYANDLSRAFHGILDDIQIYDRLLGDAEIAALAVPTGPIAHWKFDDGSGNIAIDSEGGHDATIDTPVWDPGQEGGAIRVTTLTQAAAAPHDDNLNLTKGLTLMAWISKLNLVGYDTAIDKASSGSDINYYLGAWYDEIVFGFSTATDNWQGYYTSGVGLSIGSWDHIAASFDNAANEVRIYRNGGLVQSFSSSLEPLTNTGNLWLGRSALTTEFLSGRLDDARIYNRVLDSNEIQAIYDATTGGSGGVYTEANQTWLASNSAQWQVFDLSAYGVPPNAVVEIVVENTATNAEREGGVRAVGSSLNRRFDLQEAESGGVDAVTLHVQADASSQIEHYAENNSSIRFRLVGFWSGSSYTQQDALFTAGANNSWRTRSLSPFGVSPGQVVEIIAQNINGSNEYQVGVRASGSSNTQTFDLHEAEAGGRDFLSIMVQASNDASASIEVLAENNGEIEFKVVGVWDSPPGTYNESRTVLGNPTTDGAWQTFDLSSYGVPANAIAQIVMANRFASAQNRQGVRSVGSGLERVVDIHEPENGGEDLVTMHVTVDANSQIQMKHQDVSDAHRFYLAGWWVLP